MNTLLSNSALRHCRRDHYSLQKCRKIRDFNVDFFFNFLGHSPQTLILGMGYGPPPQTPLPSALRRSSASRLRASLGTFGPSPWAPRFHISKYATGFVTEDQGSKWNKMAYTQR